MKLDQNALLSLARGFSYAEQGAEGYLHFHRFTKKGEDFYREILRGDRDRVTRFGDFAEIGRVVRAAAEAQKGVVVIDGLSLVPHDPKYFVPDGVHPNDAGFRVYAEALCKAMLPHLD